MYFAYQVCFTSWICSLKLCERAWNRLEESSGVFVLPGTCRIIGFCHLKILVTPNFWFYAGYYLFWVKWHFSGRGWNFQTRCPNIVLSLLLSWLIGFYSMFMLLYILSWEKYYHKLLYKYIRAEEVSFKLNLFYFLIVPVVLRNNWN